MNVVTVTTDFPPAVGGIQAVLYNTLRHFSVTEKMAVVAPDHPDAPAFDRGQPFAVRRFPAGRSTFPLARASRLTRMTVETLRAVRGTRGDVVLCGHPYASFVGLVARRVLGTPFVVWAHAKELLTYRDLLRRWLPRADAVLVISAHTRRLVEELGVDAARTVLIPYAPDCDPAPAGDPVPAGGGAGNLILTVARMDDLYKGHDVMLRALPLIAAKVPTVRWVVVGDGRLRVYYERMAEVLGVRDRVRFTGAVPTLEKNRLFQECRVFAMPSRDRRIDGGAEGFGLVYLEANAFGRPVVAGRAGGTTDAVVDGETGLLVDPENEVAVADAVVRLLTDADFAARLGKQGAERVQKSFGWPRTAAAVEDTLARVVRTGPVRQSRH